MFTQAPELETMARAVMQVFKETFEHLQDSQIGYLFTGCEIVTKGSRKSAYAIMPTAMGQNRRIYVWALEKAFGVYPDALIVADIEIWEELTEPQRVALVFHELRHLAHSHTKAGEPRYDEEGKPVLEVVGHDVEEFLDVADTFGAWHEGLQVFGKVLGGKADKKDVDEVLKLAKEGV